MSEEQKELIKKANEIADRAQVAARIACAPYSLEELMKMLSEGNNPLLGDKP